MKTKIIFPFTSNSRLPNIQEVRPYHRADKCITRGKNKLFIYGPQCDFVRHFRVFGRGDRGGGGLGDPILLTSYPLTYINLHITYGSKSIQDFVSYRVYKLLSNDN